MTKEQTEGVMGTLVYLQSTGLLSELLATLLVGMVSVHEGRVDDKTVVDGSVAVMAALYSACAVPARQPDADKNLN